MPSDLIKFGSAEMRVAFCVNLYFRAIDLETVKILRARVQECQRREEVNHPERCRDHVERYFQAFKKYRSEGVYLILRYTLPHSYGYFSASGWFQYH